LILLHLNQLIYFSMMQDQNNQDYNSQNNDFVVNGKNPSSSQQSNSPSAVHFSPSTVDLDALSNKQTQPNGLTNNGNNSNNNFQQSDYNFNNQPQYQPNNQFSNYNPYQNTGSNIDNLQNFAPQDNFDTGFGNQGTSQNNDFNQAGIEQYKSSTPQFNTNDPYLMPSTNPENDDLDEPEGSESEKPKRDTKKILMFGLIGLIVVLLVASLALFFLSQGNKNPAVNNATNPTSSKPTTQTVPSTEKSITSTTQNDPSVTTDATSRTGNPNTPASQAVVNQGATTLTADWLKTNFTKTKGALAEDGSCKLQNVCGPKVDPDKDGLNNIDEYIYGTNPTIADTDNDGIGDKDELFVYYSDPKNEDSNSNTYKDGVEISNCYDPNIASQKLTKARLNEISSNINKPYVNGLSTVTQNLLKTAGAKTGELEKGYLTKCAITSPQETVVPKSALSSPLEKSLNRQPATINKSDINTEENTVEGA
jgi:flagellar basal body-associated protein FliL